MADSSVGQAAKLRCELSDLADEFATSLRATNHSPATVAKYAEFIRQLIVFLDGRAMPTTAAGVHREHVEAYLVEVGEERGWKPSTARTAFASLQQFFKYLAEEGEVAESPLARMRPPKVAEEPVPVLTDDELAPPADLRREELRRAARPGDPAPVHRHRHAARRAHLRHARRRRPRPGRGPRPR